MAEQQQKSLFCCLTMVSKDTQSVVNTLLSDLTWSSKCHAFLILISLISGLSKSIIETVTINQCLPKRTKYFSLMHSYHLKELKQGHDGKTLQLGPGHHNTELQ